MGGDGRGRMGKGGKGREGREKIKGRMEGKECISNKDNNKRLNKERIL